MSSRQLRLLVIFAVILLFAAAGYRLAVTARSVSPPPPATPVRILDLVLADVDGRTQPMAQWRGRILVVNYWATWCPPCRDEMPGFSRLQDRYRNKSVQFVGISTDSAAKISEFNEQTPVSYPLLIGDQSAMQSSASLGNTHQALPFTAVFDGQGQLVATRLGRWSESDLDRQLRALVSG